jgi:hypothetical protein
MQETIGVWGQRLACVLTLACLAACNGEESGSNTTTSLNPPVANDSAPSSDPVPQQSTNAAPQIVGAPGPEVVVGQAYSFTPSAADTDGDPLTFSIASQPAWASFNIATGRLSGTPTPGDVGSYEDITITVSDGEANHALPQFAIDVVQQSNGSVTLAWQPPTENTDGTPVVNLGGYKIHYGTQSGRYDTVIAVSNPGVTRYMVDNLSPGTYFFAVTAVAASGAESGLSGEASKTI